MKLPPQYADLETRYKTPLAEQALKLYGVKEFSGDADNPIILQWAKELGNPISSYYRHDETAWCGLYMGVCAKRAGYQPPDGFDALRALSWSHWGDPVIGHPLLWDILIFKRPGGFHVGLYVGEDEKCFHVLGGNQSDQVCIVRMPKDRFLAARREPMNSCPAAKVRIFRQPSGAISSNEA